MSTKPAGEILPGRPIIQVFRATADQLSVVSPILATYWGRATGMLTVSLHQVTSLPTARHGISIGPALASMSEPSSTLEDNTAVDLFFAPIDDSTGELFALRIAATGSQPGAAATAWLTDADDRIPGHVACYIGDDKQGDYGLSASVLFSPEVAACSVPESLLYSPLTQCNLNCIHCISRDTRATAQRLSGDIKADLLQWCRDGRVAAIATDYSGDILWADHRNGGELDFLFGLDVPVHIDTNGVYLTEAVCERLVASRLFYLNISLDAATDATFRRVRKGAPPLRTVCDNIRRLMTIRERAGATFQVSMSFTLMRSTLDELPDFLRMAAGLGVKLVFARHLEAYTADMEADSLWLDRERFNQARLEAIALAESLGVTLAAPRPFDGLGSRSGHRPCPLPWHSAVMLGNGDISACCVPGMKMGNLHENTMEEIWNGPAYRALRTHSEYAGGAGVVQGLPDLSLHRKRGQLPVPPHQKIARKPHRARRAGGQWLCRFTNCPVPGVASTASPSQIVRPRSTVAATRARMRRP